MSPMQPSEELLVLRDGGVLVGTITRGGDRYVVRRAGSEIQVPAASVLTTCHRLEEAYEHQRGQLNRPSADAHLSLAEWCLRYGLLAQAARELVDARGLEPRHPRLILLERRLMAADRPRLPERGPVVPAAHIEPATPSFGMRGSDTSLVDDLPTGAVERFTRRVQPILVNNCTIAGCHQPGGKQEFQLDRALLHGLANRRSTMKNLAATLALVDRRQPQLSPLLCVPRRSHGGMQSAIFGPRHQAAFRHLEEWVALVTTPAASEQNLLPATVLPGNTAAAPTTSAAPPVKSNGHDMPEVDALSLEPPEQATPKPRQLRYGAQLQPWQPKDPFDAEIFNRRQRSRAQAAAGGTADAVTENP